MKIERAFAGILLTAAVLVSGCASIPMADPALDSAAKAFTASPGKSKIYVYRNEGFGSAVTMEVFIDGRMIGKTVAKTYLVAEVDPGAHRVMGKAENEDTLEVTTVAGGVYYFWQEVKMGGLFARNKLQQVYEATGKPGVLECKLAAPQ